MRVPRTGCAHEHQLAGPWRGSHGCIAVHRTQAAARRCTCRPHGLQGPTATRTWQLQLSDERCLLTVACRSAPAAACAVAGSIAGAAAGACALPPAVDPGPGLCLVGLDQLRRGRTVASSCGAHCAVRAGQPVSRVPESMAKNQQACHMQLRYVRVATGRARLAVARARHCRHLQHASWRQSGPACLHIACTSKPSMAMAKPNEPWVQTAAC